MIQSGVWPPVQAWICCIQAWLQQLQSPGAKVTKVLGHWFSLNCRKYSKTMAHCEGVSNQPDSTCSKTVNLDVHVKGISWVKTLSARYRHWRNSRNILVESAAIQKRVFQCTDWLSATQNGQGAEVFSTQLELNPCSATHYYLP